MKGNTSKKKKHFSFLKNSPETPAMFSIFILTQIIINCKRKALFQNKNAIKFNHIFKFTIIMKKATFTVILILVSIISFGQYLDNQFYFRFGYSSPSWKQFGLTEQEWNNFGITSKAGASFELGSIFLIKSILDRDDMSFGINADYLYTVFHNFENEDNVNGANLGVFRAGSKVGPSFTYSPVDKLEFDVYAKLDFAWATGAVIYYSDMIDDAEDFYLGKVDFGFSTGLNVRYGILMLGVEFNTISSELESDDYPGFYLQQLVDAEFEDFFGSDKKSKLPCTTFTIGLSF